MLVWCQAKKHLTVRKYFRGITQGNGVQFLDLPGRLGQLCGMLRHSSVGGRMIEVRDLAKSFGSLRVVQDVSFVARDGEITGLIGPNGAGKTTMFRLICTILRPHHGRMLIDGIDAQRDPLAARHRLGVLPDIRALYPRLTAREHLRYAGELHGIPGPELDARIDE